MFSLSSTVFNMYAKKCSRFVFTQTHNLCSKGLECNKHILLHAVKIKITKFRLIHYIHIILIITQVSSDLTNRCTCKYMDTLRKIMKSHYMYYFHTNLLICKISLKTALQIISTKMKTANRLCGFPLL